MINQIFKPKSVSAKFIVNLNQLQAVRHFVQQMCQWAPGDFDKFSFELQLVINELFCNIVKHGYRNLPKEEVTINSQVVEDGIYFTLSDRGHSFNPSDIKLPDLDNAQEGGFGLFIVRQLVDQLSYTPKTLSEEWNHLRIFKRYFSKGKPMEFSHYVQDSILVIIPIEESLDARNASAFKEGVIELTRTLGHVQLIFDLRHLQFIDSSGLGTFLSMQRTVNARKGSIKLACLNKPVKAMFEIVSIHRMLGIFDTVEEALHSF